MRLVEIAGTSIRTSRLGFGTASLHHVLSAAARRRLLERAWHEGIRYFDTAPLYGHGMAERDLGRFVRTRRGEAAVATKFGLLPSTLLGRVPPLMYLQKAGSRALGRRWGRFLATDPRRDYGARYARARIDRSLQVLATDYIDILYLHEPKLAFLPQGAELVDALADMQRQGKVRYLGLSGSLEDCVAITKTYPQLGTVWQLDVLPGVTPAAISALDGRAAQVTFGHFRNAPAAASPDAGARGNAVRRNLTGAVELNRGGVVLFSTRDPQHIQNTAATLAAIEQ